ncbi:hypothetical protein P3T65_03800 [Pseudomonas nitroreducens]|uniref:hypothetical protein n=1 Tax=Pseudomonas nitroreducens TaxID=46680 RepID=UPI0023F92E99|nr:hypothetical protein [Pseudomonas nitroreducens]WEW98844.1 hypothetical protein P3T65_03800 [Pseudomonas nitroreducens]
MPTNPLKIHVLFESSDDGKPHGCSLIRLLRPFSHPNLAKAVELTYSTELPSFRPDVVIIERLWIHRMDTLSLLSCIRALKSQGTCVIYESDDDLLHVHLRIGDRNWPSADQRNHLRLLAREADGIIVSTQPLAETLRPLNSQVQIVPNTLDEQLFPVARQIDPASARLKFGYMGTFTHLEDLAYIANPIKSLIYELNHSIEFEIVGIGDERAIGNIFKNTPVSIKYVPVECVGYDQFCSWMANNLDWNFGIAPLLQSKFSDSKSDIKFLDYSILGIPGIYSDVKAYNGTVQHEVNGLLSANDNESWLNNLRRMATDAGMRDALALQAQIDVRAQRTLATQAHRFLDAVNTILQQSKAA